MILKLLTAFNFNKWTN